LFHTGSEEQDGCIIGAVFERKRRFPLKPIVLAFTVLLVLGAWGQAQTFTTLYNFTGGADGGSPYVGVIQDQAGNLYSTATQGGDLSCQPPVGCGVVYELNAAGMETVLYSFTGPPSDGVRPLTPLVRDNNGNIYGTTWLGGSGCEPYGCGTVFKIDTAGAEVVLYNFAGESDGCNPSQGMILDGSGALFGTTLGCGSSGKGTIFTIDSAGKFRVLHGFTGSDGSGPGNGYLTMDKSGNLYGVTQSGGHFDNGELYKLSKGGKLTVLHSFRRDRDIRDGYYPYGSVALDGAGNIYGTTNDGGSHFAGTIWKVAKNGKETILHSFDWSDGCRPLDGVTWGSNGNLYGVTNRCGASHQGALYELSAKGKLTLLHSFNGPDGKYPIGEVLRTINGTLFGITAEGGSGNCSGYGCGTVWKYVP
jgi:uncharacterized repeat protein (TIGR03803 family)